MNTQRELEIRAIHIIYTKLYKNAYPSTDYERLVENAIVKDGKKLIKSKAYTISEAKFNKIVDQELDWGNFSNLSKHIIKQTIIEGCCPKIEETCK
jgi:hypothetical protein